MAPKSNPSSQKGKRKATEAEKGKRKAPPSLSHRSSSDSEPTPRRTTRPRGTGIRIDEGNTPPSVPSRDFRIPSEKKLFDERLKGRKLTKSKSVDFSYFDDEGFEFPKWIREFGLEIFLSQKEEVYEHLIRLFYFYLKWDEGLKKYTSYVQGVFIAFHMIDFAQIMQFAFTMEDEVERIPVVQKIAFLTGNENQAPAAFQARELKSIEYRILFNVICYCLYPRAGGYDKVTLDDIDLMYAIITGSKICLANTMIQYMFQQKDRTNGRLPFGMILTKLLKHFKVNFKNEKPIKFNSYNEINESTLKRMKIMKKDGRWVDSLKDKSEEEEEENEEGGSAEAAQREEEQAPQAPQAPQLHTETQANQGEGQEGFDTFSFSDLLGSFPSDQPNFPPQPVPQPSTEPSTSHTASQSQTQIDFSSLIFFMEKQFADLNSRITSIESKVDQVSTELQTVKENVTTQLSENQNKMDLIESSFTQHCPPMSKSLGEIENYLKLQQDALMKSIHSGTVALQDLRDNSDRMCLYYKLPSLPEILRELDAQLQREFKKMRASRPPPSPKKDAKPKFVPRKRKHRSPSHTPPHSPAHLSESGGSNIPPPPKTKAGPSTRSKSKKKAPKQKNKQPKPEQSSSDSDSAYDSAKDPYIDRNIESD